MANFTRATSAALDAARQALGQGRLTLTLLRHKNTGDPRGYESSIEVKRGWLLTEPRRNEPVELFICESTTVEESSLLEARAAAVGNRVYKFKGESKQKPLGSGLRLFSWEVRPTNEPHP